MTTIETNTVFKALTRPAMTAGVTFEYHALNLTVSMTAFIALGNPLYMALFIPLHVFGWLMCREDVAFFAIILKRINLPAMPNQSLWGVRSYEPY